MFMTTQFKFLICRSAHSETSRFERYIQAAVRYRAIREHMIHGLRERNYP